MKWIEDYCNELGTSLEELKRPGRRTQLVKWRTQVSVFLRGNGFSLADIGAVLDRDHSTICHHLKKAREEAKNAGRGA